MLPEEPVVEVQETAFFQLCAEVRRVTFFDSDYIVCGRWKNSKSERELEASKTLAFV